MVVSDPDPRRRETALRFGAAAAWDPSGAEPLSAVLTRLGATEPSIALEASGARSAVMGAYTHVGVGGVVVLVGSVFATEPIAIDPEDLIRRCITLRGVHKYAPRDLGDAVRFLRDRHSRYPFASLVGETFTLDQIDQAIACAAKGTHMRVGVHPR